MPKKKKFGRLFSSTKGNLIIVALLVLLTAALAMSVRYFKAEPVLLFSTEDFQQRQEMRQSDDNAFKILSDAAGKVPPPPSGIIKVGRPDNPDIKIPFEAEPGSLAGRLKIQRPDDHPDFLNYLAACAPAIEEAYSALEKPYCLSPVASGVMPGPTESFSNLFTVINVAALLDYSTNKDIPAFVDKVERIITLKRMIAAQEEPNFQGPNMLYDDVRLLIRKGISVECAKSLREKLLELGPPFQDKQALADIVFKLYDNSQLGPIPEEYQHFPQSLGARLFLMEIRKTAVYIRDHRDELIAFAAMTPAQQQAEFARNGDFPPGGPPPPPSDDNTRVHRPRPDFERHPHGPRGFLDPYRRIERVSKCAADRQNDYYITVIALAIEEYRVAHNAYPNALSDLVPDPLASIPKDPITGGDFFYALDGAFYKIYSADMDGKDDGGDKRQDDVLISQNHP